MSHSFVLPILCDLHIVLILTYSHKPFDQSPLPSSPIFHPKKPCTSPHPVPSPPRHIPSPSPQNPPPLPPPRHHHATTTPPIPNPPTEKPPISFSIAQPMPSKLLKVLGVAGDARRGEILENVASPRSGILTATTCQGLKDFISGGMDRG
ncbi:hypothetical protein E4T42_04420 [Aureobasidium subglaciale]|nr:hypothetical protein E4T42_04420 [Aureobasidium subglaciale]